MTEQTTKTNQADVINTGLIIMSLILAVQLPFRLFIYAYAFLGPLHYLTEINWLRGKNYFLKDNHWEKLCLVLVVIIVLPHFFRHVALKPYMEYKGLSDIILTLQQWSNPLILMSFCLALGFAFFKKWYWITSLVLIGGIISYGWSNKDFYMVTVGLLIPTLIHVYLFTILFMLYGAIKDKGMIAYFNVILVITAPFLISNMTIEGGSYLFPDSVKETFLANYFHITNLKIMELLRLSDGQKFYFYKQMELKFQIFISFAYIYHYLNWFSKTATIGWHKNLTKRKSLILIAIWSLLVAIFMYDFNLGVLTSLFFSFLHVLLEFPLNAISIREIFSKVFT